MAIPTAVRLLVIDEAARVPDHLYRAVRPCARAAARHILAGTGGFARSRFGGGILLDGKPGRPHREGSGASAWRVRLYSAVSAEVHDGCLLFWGSLTPVPE